jgi:hypothetical protein
LWDDLIPFQPPVESEPEDSSVGDDAPPEIHDEVDLKILMLVIAKPSTEV